MVFEFKAPDGVDPVVLAWKAQNTDCFCSVGETPDPLRYPDTPKSKLAEPGRDVGISEYPSSAWSGVDLTTEVPSKVKVSPVT
jgi:hypothetical protein